MSFVRAIFGHNDEVDEDDREKNCSFSQGIFLLQIKKLSRRLTQLSSWLSRKFYFLSDACWSIKDALTSVGVPDDIC